MDIFQLDEIFLTILGYLDIDSISSLLLINKFSNNKICKYYENNDIIFNDMPLFRPCNNISKYLTHYRSFIFGKNFPDEPLWLFNDKNDSKYIQIDNKYVKQDNGRFSKPKFFNYITTYQFIKFENGLYHWKKLNNQQKYLLWCAIVGYHPEIHLAKSIISEDLAVLLSELYWHYSKFFVRYYLEIYCIDMCDLINAKCIANREIEAEIERYRGHHFLQEYDKSSCDPTFYEYYFNFCKFSKTGNCREYDFRFQLLNVIDRNIVANIRSFKYLDVDSNKLLKEIDILLNILEEIDNFSITKVNDLKTDNINYLTHMSINYPSHKFSAVKNTIKFCENIIQDHPDCPKNSTKITDTEFQQLSDNLNSCIQQ